MNKKDSDVPGWDGSAKTWRKYHREVAWYVRSTPIHKRRYCAHRLVSKLTGPARLLAMSWPAVNFDHANGTKEFLQMLASSPLVRQNLPNAAAICTQYFAFRRHENESMQSFLVREALVHSEFTEALQRLYDEKRGVQQHELDFDLPVETEEDWYDGSYGYGDDWEQWWDAEGDYESAQRFEPDDEADGQEGAPARRPSDVVRSQQVLGDSGSPHGPASISRRSAGIQMTEAGLDSGLSLTDSFVLGVLRGFRLLKAACLSPEDMRDIIGTTKGSLEFSVVTKALQTLWDDQLLGRSSAASQGRFNAFFEETVADDSAWWEAQAAEGDWENEDWWWDAEEGEHWDFAAEQPSASDGMDFEQDEAVKEAQKAEKVVESLAVEAQRTWSEAQKATQALKRDHGFGHVMSSGRGKGSQDGCFNCGGNHLARNCPDRRHPGPPRYGKGNGGGSRWNYMADYDYDISYVKGKGKSKGKSKSKH